MLLERVSSKKRNQPYSRIPNRIRVQEEPHVVLVGGGFAGLYAARGLANRPAKVTIVDRKNHHTFQPLLYQVASAGLSPGEIAVPIREIMRRYSNVEVLLAEVSGFDLQRQLVKLGEDSLPYDYLVVAAGASHAYFGHDEWAPYAPGLKTVEDAIEIRRRVLLAFELAERKARMENKHEPLTFVIVGGGPTGVELAGALAEIAQRTIAKDFRTVDTRGTRILLVEAGPRILAAYPEDLSESAEKQLRQLGVEVMTGVPVTDIAADYVRVGEKRIPTAVTLWGAGVSASPLGKKLVEAASLPLPNVAQAPSLASNLTVSTAPVLDPAGRVLVNPDLTLPGHPEVFICGDLASLKNTDGKPIPGIAPAAIQMGQYAARTILEERNGHPRKAFHYVDKGSLATIGRKSAVGTIGKAHLTGFIAWLAWLFIHIFYLIGFRNRIAVVSAWAWAYFTYKRGARLITGNSATVAPQDASANPKHTHELDPEDSASLKAS